MLAYEPYVMVSVAYSMPVETEVTGGKQWCLFLILESEFEHILPLSSVSSEVPFY